MTKKFYLFLNHVTISPDGFMSFEEKNFEILYKTYQCLCKSDGMSFTLHN